MACDKFAKGDLATRGSARRLSSPANAPHTQQQTQKCFPWKRRSPLLRTLFHRLGDGVGHAPVFEGTCRIQTLRILKKPLHRHRLRAARLFAGISGVSSFQKGDHLARRPSTGKVINIFSDSCQAVSLSRSFIAPVFNEDDRGLVAHHIQRCRSSSLLS